MSYKILLVFTLLATVGGFLTLLPREAASNPNLMGYRSLCPFAPAATLFCFFLAGLSCFIRSTWIKDQSGSAKERWQRHRFRTVPVLLILMGALLFTGRYVQVKQVSNWDENTGATVMEEKK